MRPSKNRGAHCPSRFGESRPIRGRNSSRVAAVDRPSIRRGIPGGGYTVQGYRLPHLVGRCCAVREFAGLHRPTTTSTASTDTPSNKASYHRLLLDTASYLKEMEVPDRFIQLMANTASTEIRWHSGREAKSLEQVPSIAEWLTGACRAKRGSDCTTLKIVGPRRHQRIARVKAGPSRPACVCGFAGSRGSRKAYGEAVARADVPLERRSRARASSASIAANSFSMARADGAPRLSLRRIVSATSFRTSS
jgi:hypothetical protein